MKCPKCGTDLSADNKFCPNCGEKKAVELSSNLEQKVKNSESKGKNKIVVIWNKLGTYERVSVVAIIIFVLMTVVAIVAGKTVAVIFSVVSIALVVVSYLLKKGKVKAPKSWLNIVALVLAFVLIIPYVGIYKVNYGNAENFEWSSVVLNEIIPEPDSLFGDLHSNSSEYFSVDIYKVDKNDFNNYVEDCKEKGFTIDIEQLSDSFYAFNEAGYKVSVSYSEYGEYISITLEAPEKYDNFEWPINGLVTVIPQPKSNVGKIEKNDAESCSIYVSKMTLDDYKNYISTCSKAGFNIESLNNEKSYSAKNTEGYKLTVEYKGNNVIHISVLVPEYKVSVEIECVENLMFSTYDIDVYLDGNLEGTVVHGGTKTFDLTLKKGTYTLKFVSEDDKLENEVILHIYQNENLRYKLSCFSTEIDIETLVGTLPPKNNDGAIAGYKVDYADAKLFESALNEGKKVNGKIVQFIVNDYKPDSALGINCWAGEHLNFISKKELTVSKGDTIVAYVTSEPSKIFDSWEIKCEVLVVNNVKTDVTVPTEQEKTTEPTTEAEKVTESTTSNKTTDLSHTVLPKDGSKVAKDYYFTSSSGDCTYYVNVDGTKNVPKLKKWKQATVTDGVAEYLDYLQSLGFNIKIDSMETREPYAGFHTYDTTFIVSNSKVSWEMTLMIQDEAYVEYELDVEMK